MQGISHSGYHQSDQLRFESVQCNDYSTFECPQSAVTNSFGENGVTIKIYLGKSGGTKFSPK